MKEVRERLYIGNICDAAAVLTAASPPVTHMLSLITSNIDPLAYKRAESGRSLEHQGNGAVEPASTAKVKLERLTFPLRDTESQNLLEYLEGCLEFIERGRSDGKVLVHCFAGVSRSAAVVTAYLMRTEHLSVDDALASLEKVKEDVCPNDGFMQQLQIFEEMGFVVDRSSSLYKKFNLENLGEAYGKGEKIEISRYAADPGSTTDTDPDASDSGVFGPCGQEGETPTSTVYRCRKCRRVVACQEHVIAHDPGSGETSFKWRRRGRWGAEDGEPDCTSIFVEPLQWMTTVQEGTVEGKLNCVNCEARLGNFNWVGMQCSCGTWVHPAFQLHKSRIDAPCV